jgi:hypothetical protein
LEEAGLWETRPRVSAAATSAAEVSRSGDSEPGRPRRRVRRGPTSPAGEEEQEEEEVGVGEPAAAEADRPM